MGRKLLDRMLSLPGHDVRRDRAEPSDRSDIPKDGIAAAEKCKGPDLTDVVNAGAEFARRLEQETLILRVPQIHLGRRGAEIYLQGIELGSRLVAHDHTVP